VECLGNSDSFENYDDDDIGLHVMGKALFVLERLLHNCACGVNLNEVIARKKLQQLLNREALNHHLISCMLKGYSVLSPHVILRDIYPGSLDQLDLILSLVPPTHLYKTSPHISSSFAASIGSLKVCLHSIYKHVLVDAFDELVCGEIAGDLSTYGQTLSPCDLLNTFLSTYLELFGDMVLHLLVPLELPSVKIRYHRNKKKADRLSTEPEFFAIRSVRNMLDFKNWRKSYRQDKESWFSDNYGCVLRRFMKIPFKSVPHDRLNCCWNRMTVFPKYFPDLRRLNDRSVNLVGKAPNYKHSGFRRLGTAKVSHGLYYVL
jgi:hypothetical protein